MQEREKAIPEDARRRLVIQETRHVALYYQRFFGRPFVSHLSAQNCDVQGRNFSRWQILKRVLQVGSILPREVFLFFFFVRVMRMKPYSLET